MKRIAVLKQLEERHAEGVAIHTHIGGINHRESDPVPAGISII